MISISKSVKNIIQKGFELLRNHKADDFHQLFELTKLELLEKNNNPKLIALLAAFQAEEYYNIHDYSKAFEMMNQALKYDNQYLYLFFQAILYEETKQGQKTIPIYEELLLRDEEKGYLPEDIRYFILNNIATNWFHLPDTPDWHKKKYGEKIKYDYAQEHYLKVLDAPVSVNEAFNYLKTNALNGIGYTMALKNQIEDSKEYFKQALETQKKVMVDNPDIVINSLNGYAWCEYKNENYPMASHHYTKANRLAISVFGEFHPITTKLAQNLALTWKERMGFEETGINQIKWGNLDEKRSNQRAGAVKSRSSFYFNPNKKPETQKIAEVKNNDKEIEIPLYIAEEINQKVLPIKSFLPSLTTTLLEEMGWFKSKKTNKHPYEELTSNLGAGPEHLHHSTGIERPQENVTGTGRNVHDHHNSHGGSNPNQVNTPRRLFSII